MQVSRADLWWAASKGVIGREQVEPLWQALSERGTGRPSFDLPHLAYYVGALIVISAMGWFMNQAWEAQGGGALLAVAVAYGVIFASVGWRLWTREGLRVPGGLLVTTAVCMVPLAVYALERLTGIWPHGDPGPYRGYHVWVKGSWFLMEVATIVAGLVALAFVRFPFLTAPIAFSLWYMSMDLTPLLFGRTDFTWDERLWVSLGFGLAMLVVTYLIDRRTEEDFAFWGYLFGLAAFWGGLSLMKSQSELGRALYCAVNVGLMLLSVLLERRAFIVFGGLGVFGYVGYLAYRVFQGSLLFPFVLTIIGIGVIFLGIQYQRRRPAIERAILGVFPEGARRLLPPSRG
jgi:hypothetical protein